MRTKDKILQEALHQFNTIGTDQVSIRSIADAVGISAGNLAYHFKNTDAIIHQLYLNLVEALDSEVQQIQESLVDMQYLLEATQRTYRALYEYRFLMIDFVAICRRIPDIKTHFSELMSMRQQQFLLIFKYLQSEGWLRHDLDEQAYAAFAEIIIIFSNAWLADAVIRQQPENAEQQVAHYRQLFIQLFIPYLTQEGLQQFQQLITD